MDGFCGKVEFDKVVGAGFLPQLSQFVPGMLRPLLQPVLAPRRQHTAITENDHRANDARMVVRPYFEWLREEARDQTNSPTLVSSLRSKQVTLSEKNRFVGILSVIPAVTGQ